MFVMNAQQADVQIQDVRMKFDSSPRLVRPGERESAVGSYGPGNPRTRATVESGISDGIDARGPLDAKGTASGLPTGSHPFTLEGD